MVDYEKLYKETLAKAREIHRNENEKRFDMEWLFPELKGSEDEKIRKTLIRFFKDQYSNDTEMYDGSVTVGEALAWLEKQGNQKIVDKVEPTPIFRVGDTLKRKGKDYTFVVDRIQGGYYHCDHSNGAFFPIEEQDNWELVEQKLRYEVSAGGSLIIVNGKPFDYENATITQKDFALPSQSERKSLQQVLNDMKNDVDYFVRYAEAFVKEQEQKSAWSEEDKEMFDRIDESLYYYATKLRCEKDYSLADAVKEEQSWLFSLKNRIQPQPKQEWSEEDKKMYRMCIDAVEYYHTPEDESVVRDWLKSLKDRVKG